MSFINKVKKSIVSRVQKLESEFWKIDLSKEKDYCVFYNTHFWVEDMEAEKNQFKNQNRLAFFDFFVECESRYHYHYKQPLLLDPQRGWLIDEKSNTLFSKSYPYYNNPFSGSIYYPSIWEYFRPFRRVTTLKQAVSIPYGWENYFHFFIETVPQLVMLNELNIDKNIPVIIPQHAMDFPYVKDFLEQNNVLADRKIILQQKDEYIKIKGSTHVFKDFAFPKASIFALLNNFKETSFLRHQGVRKVYLKRAADQQRAIVNTSEIEEFLTVLGYETVHAESLSLQEQINLFSSTAKLVAIHGAGLTNIIFRFGRQMDVIEIFPEGHAPEHYKILAALLGFNYTSVTGSPFDANKQFTLPLEKLKAMKSL